jgi:type III pantothenate kinase
MKTLYMDIGNSRVKWYGDAAKLSACAHHGEIRACVNRIVDDMAPERVVVVDVTGAVPDDDVTRLMTAGPAACGVTNGYRDVGQLGPDRWAALIGAWALVGRPVCVVDAGTALTVDVLDSEGRHLGGWIAPGEGLSITALLGHTHGIRFESSAGEQPATPGRDTETAVLGGIRDAGIGLVERACRNAASRLGETPALVITGGDGALLADALDDAIWVEDLVLQGLVRWDEDLC